MKMTRPIASISASAPRAPLSARPSTGKAAPLGRDSIEQRGSSASPAPRSLAISGLPSALPPLRHPLANVATVSRTTRSGGITSQAVPDPEDDDASSIASSSAAVPRPRFSQRSQVKVGVADVNARSAFAARHAKFAVAETTSAPGSLDGHSAPRARVRASRNITDDESETGEPASRARPVRPASASARPIARYPLYLERESSIPIVGSRPRRRSFLGDK